MRLSSILLALLLLSLDAPSQTAAVQPGIEVLRARGFEGLKGKRVGLITNPTGVTATLQSTIDVLFTAPGVTLVALFGPEHGVRGNHAAGKRVDAYTDEATGLPVYSLYGRTRKPTVAMLRGIDVLVYDIQDIGCRSYTYISTMGLAMEAAAENDIAFMVLDRPDPLGGERMEGMVVQPGFASFVGQYPIPYVYGLTCGELARMLNEEGMLTNSVRCRLTVVPMKGWERRLTFQETGLPWVPTSPNIPESSTPAHYVSTGILGELGAFSVGIGYTLPFKVLAAPGIDPKAIADRLNRLGLAGVLFRPVVFTPFADAFKDSTVGGVQIHFTDHRRAELIAIQFHFLEALHDLYPDRNPLASAEPSRLKMFDKVVGSDQLRVLFTTRMKVDDVRMILTKGVGGFRGRAGRYFLY